MLSRILHILNIIDSWLLVIILVVRTFLIEWFSWTLSAIERGLIAIYVILFVEWNHSSVPVWLTISFIPLALFIGWTMWVEQEMSTDMRRFWKLTSVLGFFARCFFVTLTIISHFTPVLIPFTLFHLSTCLPDIGIPGRKRKEAFAKLKSRFARHFAQPLPA